VRPDCGLEEPIDALVALRGERQDQYSLLDAHLSSSRIETVGSRSILFAANPNEM
jgi:hypothetical protein